MFRLISLGILLTVVCSQCCVNGPKSCPWKHPPHHFHHGHQGYSHHRYSIEFDRIADKVIESDQTYQEYCKTNANIVQEEYGLDGYILKYNLSGFDENSMTVQMKHRVIFVKAVKSTEVFQDVKVLSDILKIEDAKWYRDEGLLVVNVPYKMVIDVEKTSSCGGTIKWDTFNVAQVATPSPEVDVRMLYK